MATAPQCVFTAGRFFLFYNIFVYFYPLFFGYPE